MYVLCVCLCGCWFICIWAYTHVCICVCSCICVCTVYLLMWVLVHLHVGIHVYVMCVMCVCVYVGTYGMQGTLVCLHVFCVYVCMCVRSVHVRVDACIWMVMHVRLSSHALLLTCMRRPKVNIIRGSGAFHFAFEMLSLTGLEPTDSGCVAHEREPQFPSPSPQQWEGEPGPLCWCTNMGVVELTSFSCL